MPSYTFKYFQVTVWVHNQFLNIYNSEIIFLQNKQDIDVTKLLLLPTINIFVYNYLFNFILIIYWGYVYVIYKM